MLDGECYRRQNVLHGVSRLCHVCHMYQCKPAFICEKHRAPVGNSPILVFSGECQTLCIQFHKFMIYSLDITRSRLAFFFFCGINVGPETPRVRSHWFKGQPTKGQNVGRPTCCHILLPAAYIFWHQPVKIKNMLVTMVGEAKSPRPRSFTLASHPAFCHCHYHWHLRHSRTPSLASVKSDYSCGIESLCNSSILILHFYI